MVSDAGSPGIKRQLVQPENLKGMEARYEQALAELGKAVKVKALELSETLLAGFPDLD